MKNEIIKVWNNNFAIMKSKKFYPNAFANIKDKDELTVVMEENKIKKRDIIQIERGWRLITFNLILDFKLVGFISKISSSLAKAKISTFVISSYSTDHIFVKKEKLKKTIEILKKIKI